MWRVTANSTGRGIFGEVVLNLYVVSSYPEIVNEGSGTALFSAELN